MAHVDQLGHALGHDGAPGGLGAAVLPAWVETLSWRDRHVLRLLADGRSTADIAAEMKYSESTIKNVIHDTVRQLGARNRANAVAMAIRAGVI